MGFDIYGIDPSSHKDPMESDSQGTGDYFRANVWWWRPLWSYVTLNCSDILTGEDMGAGNHNSGHVINRTKAFQISVRLRLLDSNGETMKYEKSYNEYLKGLPDEKCVICEGTGLRTDAIGIEQRINNPEYLCNSCGGKKTIKDFKSHYPFESDFVMQFAEFCRESGGFEIS
tara:strand:- start:5390 stop:5905 length:516 start_codon:yes stop_codon:yes gene_type:complete